ncbi:hypothetical protein PN432_19980 [Microcystis aeruginosa CS-579]|nr:MULTISPECIES: hypothetical protein [Microcystis]MDB9393143.1 hypothetical protein [Microcystis aeruginosa CS-579]
MPINLLYLIRGEGVYKYVRGISSSIIFGFGFGRDGPGERESVPARGKIFRKPAADGPDHFSFPIAGHIAERVGLSSTATISGTVRLYRRLSRQNISG